MVVRDARVFPKKVNPSRFRVSRPLLSQSGLIKSMNAAGYDETCSILIQSDSPRLTMKFKVGIPYSKKLPGSNSTQSETISETNYSTTKSETRQTHTGFNTNWVQTGQTKNSQQDNKNFIERKESPQRIQSPLAAVSAIQNRTEGSPKEYQEALPLSRRSSEIGNPGQLI